MKICYIENMRLPTEKAHGVQIMKTCEAFARLGHTVELIVPRRTNHVLGDPFEYYSIERIFTITQLPTLNVLYLGKIGFWIQTIIFSEFSAWYIRFKKPDLVYSREHILLLNLMYVAKNFIWESHRGEWNAAVKRIVTKAKKIVVISQGLKDFYQKKMHEEHLTNDHNILVVPDGVDLPLFTSTPPRHDCRKKLGLPLDKKIALYSGHLYDWKGAHVLAEASQKFVANEIAVFVGGTDVDLQMFNKKYGSYPNCIIVGHRPYHEIPLFLSAADVLVLPNSGKTDMSRLYTSPIKLFEYLASGVPIIASDLPSIREILNETNSILVEPDNVEALAYALKKAFNDSSLAGIMSLAMKSTIKKYSWEARVTTILNSLV